MINRFWRDIGSLCALASILVPVSGAYAAIDKFEPYIKARVVNDSNLFRLSGDDEARAVLGTTKMDDTIGYLGGGFRSDLKLSRQHLLLDGEAERVQYKEYDDLNHTRLKGRGAWAWQLGNLWSGELGARYERRMRSFNQNKIPEKDMRTRKVGYLTAGYKLHPDWELLGGASYATVDYQDRTQLNRDISSGDLEVQYRNTLNTRVGLRARYTDYDLQSQNIGGTIVSNDYVETDISGVFYWEGSAKSKLELRLGYTSQSRDQLNERDYNGTTGRLTYDWILTGKTKLAISAWQETSTLDDEVSSYVLTRGASIAPVWSVTRLISLEGLFSYYNDNFKARDDFVPSSAKRDDDVYLASVNAYWTPRNYLKFSLGYRWQKRDSSIQLNDFTDKQIDARAQFRF